MVFMQEREKASNTYGLILYRPTTPNAEYPQPIIDKITTKPHSWHVSLHAHLHYLATKCTNQPISN